VGSTIQLASRSVPPLELDARDAKNLLEAQSTPREINQIDDLNKEIEKLRRELDASKQKEKKTADELEQMRSRHTSDIDALKRQLGDAQKHACDCDRLRQQLEEAERQRRVLEKQLSENNPQLDWSSRGAARPVAKLPDVSREEFIAILRLLATIEALFILYNLSWWVMFN